MSVVDLIFVCVLSYFTQTLLQEVNCNKTGPGNVGCGLYPYIKSKWNRKEVPYDKLPENCTSFFNGAEVICDESYNVQFYQDDRQSDEDFTFLFLNQSNKAKPMYIFYTHGAVELWNHVLSCNDCGNSKSVVKEMEGIDAFLARFSGITGIVLSDFEYTDQNSEPFYGFTNNLITYLKGMRAKFPDLEIGLKIKAKFIVDFFSSCDRIEWLDISKLMEYLDFFVVDLTTVNNCTVNIICGGLFPVNGNEKYTIKKVNDILMEWVPKEKLYFYYRMYPKAPTLKYLNELTYQQVCLNKSATAEWCIETPETLKQKGEFARDNGNGFILTTVNMDYYTKCDCQCQKDYPILNYILDGYKSTTGDYDKCALLNCQK